MSKDGIKEYVEKAEREIAAGKYTREECIATAERFLEKLQVELGMSREEFDRLLKYESD